MGCDIHCYIEHRIFGREYWSAFGGRINPGRNYAIFGRLAGVRRETKLHPPVRGIPSDIAWQARDDYWLWISYDATTGGNEVNPETAERYHSSYGAKYYYSGDGKPIRVEAPYWHTASWVTPNEWDKAIDGYADESEYLAMLAAMRSLEFSGHEVRVVFWFDN